MSDYLSGGISFGGIGSGTDFQAMIDQLKKVELIPKNRLITSHEQWTKKYKAFEELIKTVKDAEASLSKLSSVGAILKKEGSVSNTSIASVKASSDATDGTHTIDVKQLATNTILSNNHIFDSKTVNINNTGSSAIFAYEYKGKTYEVEVPPDSDLEYLTTLINKDSQNPGVKANLIKTGDGYMFSLEGTETGANATLSISNNTTLPDFKSSVATSGALANGEDTIINTSGTIQQFSVEYNGKTFTFDIPPGTTAKELQTAINENTKNTGVRATFVKNGSDTVLQLEGTIPNQQVKVTASPTDLGSFTSSGQAGWNKRDSQDAIFNINGWEQELTSSTNELTEVIPGLQITLLSEGKTQITIKTSTDEAKEQIEKAVESINSVLSKIQELTKATAEDKDDSKDTSSSSSKIPSYLQSPTQVKAGLFTGDTGIQMLSTRLKSIFSSNGLGFSPKQTADGPGDVFSSLASIGIVVDADEGSETFGQLKILDRETIGPDAPYTTLDEALKKDPQAVADILAGNSGVSDSTDFSYQDHISGKTQAGTYDVKYSVDASGTIGDVYIGGVKASLSDPAKNIYTVTSGPATGLSIAVNNHTPGITVESTVRVKQGKLSQIQEALKAEVQQDPLKEKTGPLIIMQDNYKDVMKNLETRIEKETQRVTDWERRMRLKFSRLDSVLAKYNEMMSANAASLGQLGA